MNRIILHIDFDSFFASVEQQDNPLWRGRPLGVTATNGRSCIIAASREAKKLGIKSPSLTYDAQKICPGIIFVPAHFVRYWEVSKQFIKICDSFSPIVEVFSLDEVFMDVTLTAKLFGGLEGLIEQFKERLKTEIGEYITASVGIAHNRMLAKLASGLKKPNGIVLITPENLLSVYKSAKLTDICGIGFRIEKRLHQMGIYTLLQLRVVSEQALIAEFGQVEGKFLKSVGLGLDDSPVVPYSERPEVKSVGRQYCLPHNEYNKRKVLQNVYELCEEVALKLRRLEKKARTVGIYLGGSTDRHGRLSFQHYIDSGSEVFAICQNVLNHEARIMNYGNDRPLIQDSLFMIPDYVRRIGIWVAGLKDANTITLPLLEREQKEQKITKIIDGINEKFGDHTIRNGFLLYADKLTTVPNGYGTDQYERQKLAKSFDV